MTENTYYILADKDKDNDYTATELIQDLEHFYSGLEYGDVNEREHQVWVYPSGVIYEIQPDRVVKDEDHYSTPYTTKGTVWLPKLVEVERDKEKVVEAYARLRGLETQRKAKSSKFAKFFKRRNGRLN